MRVSHPFAENTVLIYFEVIAPIVKAEPVSIEVSESPLILRKDEVKKLEMILLNGTRAQRDQFQWKVTENNYAVDVAREGDFLVIKGLKPGATKLRIINPAAARDYELMLLVDNGLDLL